MRSPWVKNTARRGDVVMTQRGASLGEVAIVPNDSSVGLYVISQTMMRMTPSERKVDVGYLLHYLCSPIAQTWLQNHQIATGQPHLNLGIFRRVPVIVPSRGEQKLIAETLDGIELNSGANLSRIEQLRRIKSALMSVLLTGELRVKLDEAAP